MIPSDMHVPELRKDISNPSNVRWLLRNLFIRNRNHPEFSSVMDKLEDLVKDESDTFTTSFR